MQLNEEINSGVRKKKVLFPFMLKSRGKYQDTDAGAMRKKDERVFIKWLSW